MYKRFVICIFSIFAFCLLTACASRNEVCNTCIERKDERLMDAAAQLYPEAVQRLLSEGAEINAKDKYGETPLMKALRQPITHSLENIRPLENTVDILLNAGADIDITNVHGVELLELALETRNIEVIKLLNNHMSQKDRDTMMMRALADKQYNIAWYLIESGANPTQINDQNQSALHLAVNTSQPHTKLFQYLLNSNDVNLMDVNGTTAVMTACANAAPVTIVKALLDKGAVKNIYFNKNNLLYLALTAENENLDLIKYLLNNGFNANDIAANGQPFIVVTAKMDRIHSAKILMNAGADTSVLDKYGENAYHARLNILSF